MRTHAIHVCSLVTETCNSHPMTVTMQNKKGQLSLTNLRDACETFAQFM